MTAVQITSEAQKQYDRLPPNEKNKIKRKLISLQEEPLAGKKLTGEFKELRSLRAWPYRIIYSFDPELEVVTVHSILQRQGAYK